MFFSPRPDDSDDDDENVTHTHTRARAPHAAIVFIIILFCSVRRTRSDRCCCLTAITLAHTRTHGETVSTRNLARDTIVTARTRYCLGRRCYCCLSSSLLLCCCRYRRRFHVVRRTTAGTRRRSTSRLDTFIP